MSDPGVCKETGTGRREGGETAERVLAIIRDLCLEMHPDWGGRLVVMPESHLDRDLGYDSLARAELLMRLNRGFGIRIPDRLVIEASKAADVCAAVLAATPAAGLKASKDFVRPITLPRAEAPTHASTLIEVLLFHVREHADRPHLDLWRSDADEQHVSFGALHEAAESVAAALLDEGVEPRDRVAIMLPTGLGFFHAFFGVIMMGAIPVPIYPPLRISQVEDHLRRQAGILVNAGARMLLTDAATRRAGRLLHGLVGSLESVRTVEELRDKAAKLERPYPAEAGDTALIQYTSGSTGDPKGVVLTHANLLANIRAMGQVMEARSDDIFVSWLPLYHDMGLIGAWLGSLYYGVPAIIMSPLAFIADPGRWLWAIHRNRATLSAAPNFAFDLCLKRIADADIEGLDLSSLRMVVNGAEPVSPHTIARFTERFGRYGFSPAAMAPVYGLAESSVGLAFPPPNRKPLIDRVERRALAGQGMARPAAADDATALQFVACGQPLPGHQIRIVDGTGREVAEREVGRLEFKGPSATSGYFRNPEKTRALFHGEWLDTGDLGYLAEGDIYLTGRVKDMIIRAGRNVYPHEVEECVGNVDGVRKGCVAVIAGTDERTGTERLIIVAETRITDPAMQENLRQDILQASTTVLELPPDEIVLVPPHAVPKTSSGKIRRSTTRELYEAGQLGRTGHPLWRQIGRLTVLALVSRVGRVMHTAGAFAYAAWWWVALVTIACAVWPLVLVLPRRRWRHAAVGRAVRLLFSLTGIPFSVERRGGDIPAHGVVIVANHASYLDGAVISAAIPGPLSFVATERFGHQFVAGPFLRRLGTIFVRDAATSLTAVEDDTLRALRAGDRVVAFPEGRLRRMPGLLTFYPGPFVVAARTGVPVLPVTIRGTRSVLRDSRNWFPRRAAISVHISEPILPQGTDFDAALGLSRAVRSEILRHSREPDLGREEIDFGIPEASRRN